MEHSIPSKNEGQMSPLTGIVDGIGADMQTIKEMGVEDIVLGYSSRY